MAGYIEQLYPDIWKKVDGKSRLTDNLTNQLSDCSDMCLLLSQLRPRDQVCVLNFSRLSRSLRSLLKISEEIQSKGADLVSLNDGVDTSTPVGRFTFHIFGALNDYFIDNLRSNTRAGWGCAPH